MTDKEQELTKQIGTYLEGVVKRRSFTSRDLAYIQSLLSLIEPVKVSREKIASEIAVSWMQVKWQGQYNLADQIIALIKELNKDKKFIEVEELDAQEMTERLSQEEGLEFEEV